VREANVAASHLLGVPAEFLVGKPLPSYFEENASRSYRQQLDRLCGSDRVDDWEITLVPRNGVPTAVAISIGRLSRRDRKTLAYSWLLRDISKRRLAETTAGELHRQLEHRVASRTTQLAGANKVKDELLISERAAREQAEASNRVKAEFLALLSHEFRTPLQAIFGYTELLDREIHGPLTEAQRGDLRRIQQGQQHLLGLINTVLEFAKLESDHPPDFSLGPVQLAETLAAVEALVGPSLEEKELNYSCSLANPATTCHGNAEKIRQIVLNLVTNAIKFSEPKGRVTLGCVELRDAVEISVTDYGRGIPADDLEKIFEPFAQLKAKGSPSYGIGLGLALSRRLTRAMGGSLTASSDPGKGSTFTLRLPAALPA
jgi:signal transduction histidine kinase